MFEITLRAARESRGFSVEEIAIACGVSVENIKFYENDTSKLPFNLARKLKRILSFKLEQMHIGKESDFINIL